MTAANRKITSADLAARYGGIADGVWLKAATVAGQLCDLWLTRDGEVCAQTKGKPHSDTQLALFVGMELGTPLPSYTARATEPLKPIPTSANDNRKDAAKPVAYPGLVSSGDLVRGFVPPDYQIDGIVQAGFLYSTTAMTGTGKTALLLLVTALTALGEPLGDREVRKGRAVYFAGENPDDVTMRWIAMAHHMPFDPDTIDVHFIKGTFSIPETLSKIREDVVKLGGADLIVIDTSAAYFQGDDENGNAQAGKHARDLRALTTLPGHPCVLVACHPTKNPDPLNLLPRGGGAFVAEVDGNLTLQRVDGGAVKLHWQGKHRGPDFEPVHFDLKTVTAPTLVDSKGRDVPTVMAQVLSVGEKRERAHTAKNDDFDVLLEIERSGKQSLVEIAATLDWSDAKGAPDKERARRACARLKKHKFTADDARQGRKLTKAGRELAVGVRADKRQKAADAEAIAGMVANGLRRVANRVEHET